MTTVVKLESVGDWEALFVGGECVKQNHIGRISVCDYISGVDVTEAAHLRVNLPEDDHHYPDTLEEIVDDDRYEFEMEDI